MFKLVLVAGLVVAGLPSAAFAACSPEEAMTKVSDISDVLMPKMSAKPDEGSKIMSEMGEATGSGNVTAETCGKLDALMVRARQL